VDRRKVIQNDTLLKVGGMIYDARKSKGWSQTVLADFMECSMGSIGAWERGIHDIPLTKLVKVCNLLNIDQKEIFND